MNNYRPSAYDPKATEEKIYKFWEDNSFFSPKKPTDLRGSTQKNYVIHLPPPNVTGSLHMGHALNASLTDVLIRYHRMRGYRTVWFPGTDHAGIATQNVVEKQLKKEGVSRWDLGREKFIEKVWDWKNKYGNIIIEQLKKLGASCDWSRLRFTMDPAYADSVKKAFVHYYEKGLIYRGKRVVNWCPRCQTSLSDLEIEYKEEKTKLWYIKYPIAGKGLVVAARKTKTANDTGSHTENQTYIVVATTRPETMLGDAAVAVNPKDKRYKDLVGKKVLLPIFFAGQDREIPIVSDKAIDMKFGTGAVKVTPAHDFLDAEIAERHNLPFYQIIDERGRLTSEAGRGFEGLKILEAREKVIAELTKLNFIEKIEDYDHNLATCYRCGTVLEPLLSNQWFLKMKDLAKKTLQTTRSKKVQIIPKNFEKILFSWLENIKDWTISRQIWWGHRLPVWFHESKCVPKPGREEDVERCHDVIVSVGEPKCQYCDAKFIQSEDVLDTWFSSALWPFAGLSEQDLQSFYPSNVLITARDIINLWVARMIFSGLEFMKKPPFPEVLIHATVLTQEGKRMSKSLGTGIDPIELIDKYGADATRFGIIWQAMGTQDIHWDETAVQAGKKFANKLWNIARYVSGAFSLSQPVSSEWAVGRKTKTKNDTNSHAQNQNDHDREILQKLGQLKKSVEKDIEKYKMGLALHGIYDFVWHEFADKYIESTKGRNDESAKETLLAVLIGILKILHPFLPFITEEIWQRFVLPVRRNIDEGGSRAEGLSLGGKDALIISEWPS